MIRCARSSAAAPAPLSDPGIGSRCTRCREAGIEISMGCTSAYDNAVAESFFASLTKDLLRRQPLRSRAEARTAVFDYIETFYNRRRLRKHKIFGYLTPAETRQRHQHALAA